MTAAANPVATGVTVSKPNCRRGAKHRRWTDEEWAIIERALDTGKTVKDIRHLIPYRNDGQLHNGFNMVRRRRRNLCPSCGVSPKPDDKAHCDDCRARQTQRREEALAQGLCGQCQHRPADASLTRCSVCMAKHEKYKKKPKGGSGVNKRYRIAGPGCVRWLGNGTPKGLLSLLPIDQKRTRFVDLFGGSAAYSIAMVEDGWDEVVYNDIHPGLVNYLRVMQGGQINEVLALAEGLAEEPPELLEHLYSNPPQDRPLLNAAVFFLMSYNVDKRDMATRSITALLTPKRDAKRRFQKRAKTLTQVSIHEGDFSAMIERYDSPDTLFFADPPWPGSSSSYEHTLTHERHVELSERLRSCQGRYILLTSSTRENLQMVKDHAHLSWWVSRQMSQTFRSILASNVPLNTADTIDPAKYGL